MYFGIRNQDSIMRANLDGSRLEKLGLSGVSNPMGIALDLDGPVIYWTERDWPNGDKIKRANLSGVTPPQTLHHLSTPGNDLSGIALFDGMMYWSHDEGTIYRSDPGRTTPEGFLLGRTEPEGIAIVQIPTATATATPTPTATATGTSDE